MSRFEGAGGRVAEVPDAAEVEGSVRLAAGPLPQVALAYEAGIRTLWLTIRPEPKPVVTPQLLESVVRVQRAMMMLWGGEGRYGASPVRYLAFRGEGAVFSLGGDLDFYLDCLAAGDREALEGYARLSVECACRNANGLGGLVVTLATVHARAVGGGVDLARACNVAIAEEGASFTYPELRANQLPITAVGVLARRLGAREAERLLTSGEVYSAEDFHGRGGLEAVVPDGTGEAWLRTYAAETLPTHAARTALFTALGRRAGSLDDELTHAAELWTEAMLRMGPQDIARLQRLARAQERSLTRLYRALA